ncbi:MAG TPA: S41 family peptidase [Patescibacteria group bacterium]|nr:S41 family peptidase [Patescibacteria group bacterium]
MPVATEKVRKKGSKLKRIGRWTINIAFVLLVLWLGMAIGSGRIILGKEAIFHKPVSGNLPANLNYSSVEQVYDTLKTSYDGKLDANKLLDGIKSGLAQATGDPYTEYFSPADAKNFNSQLSGTFSGIGAELGKDSNGNLTVISPIAGSPADKAGLKSKDLIAKINGTSTSGMSVDDAVSRIRGDKGTKVTLQIVRDQSPTLSITITRDNIKIPSVTSKILPGNIGYIQITQFSDDTSQLATKAANDFKQAGVKGIVLDMRGDPGGLLDAAVNVSSLWLPSGKTILTERRGGEVVQTYASTGTATLQGIKTVVLIDGGSASASEITAGALHDNGAAQLIGVTSYGKGSVQEIDNLPGGAELKVTIARWYTPDGKNIDKQGIKPDQVVQIPVNTPKGQDPQLDAATVYLAK